MFSFFVWAIVISLVFLNGCSERYRGSLLSVPTTADESVQTPTESDVIEDLFEMLDDFDESAEVVSRTISVEAHVFLVEFLRDGEPHWVKATYFYLQGEWILLHDFVQM